MNRARATICIFTKPPLPGVAKTRLIPAFGAPAAAAIARALVADAFSAAAKLAETEVWLSVTERFKLDGDPACPQFLQPEGDLGCRIEATLRSALQTAPAALAIGADTPGLSTEMLAAALASLAANDAVLGPTQDGGFWLLGIKTCPVGLLSGIRWSGPDTGADAVAALGRHGLRSALLDVWFDLDTPDDLRRTQRLLAEGLLNAPCLAAALAALSAPLETTL